MADFNFYINRQGIQGRKGDKGDTGFSPTISVGTDTLNEYKLIIANEVNSFETPNLRGNINVLDNGGTYLRYDAETQQISAQSLDAATSTTVGGVLMSTASDIETMGDNTVITPANLADALPVYLQGEGAVTITQDAETSKTKINVDLSSVDALSTRVSNAETAIVGLQTDVANIDSEVSTLNNVTASHTTSISAINNNIADLNNNKVAKTDFATTETAGIVKVDGTTITSTKDGTISANLNYTLPTASTTQLGGVKVDGTTITVDENGVITSVGGGSTGDVTAAGNNTFTGSNTFTSTTTFNAPIAVTSGGSTIEISLNEDTSTNIDLKVNSQADLILGTGTVVFGGNDGKTQIRQGNIKDGDGNIMLSQGNVTAGDNITIEKTDAGIKISSTASGGGGATIDDNNISTTTVYSSDKTVNLATNLVDNAMITLNQSKQDTLVSGTNIKTINGQSILGEGDITISGGGSGEDVPIATMEVAGKVKPDGTTITVTPDGTISANSSYTLPTASTTQLGGVKVDGTSVTINSDGVISAAGSAPTNMMTTDTGQTVSGVKSFTQGLYVGDNTTGYYTRLTTENIEMRYANQQKFLVGFAGDTTQIYGANSLRFFCSGDGNGITFIPRKANGLKYAKSHPSDPNYTILHTGNVVAGDGVTLTPDENAGTLTISALGGGGSTNITSADSSITVTKSDTGVDIVANKDIVTGYAFPSNRYVDLELGASGTNYTAPANGWVTIAVRPTTAGHSVGIHSGNLSVNNRATSNNNFTSVYLPVTKGYTFVVSYDGEPIKELFRFVYAFGAESEAQ